MGVARTLRILGRVVIALAIGAVVSLIVAAACAMTEQGPTSTGPSLKYWEDARTREVFVWTAWEESPHGRTVLLTTMGRGLGLAADMIETPNTFPCPPAAVPSGERRVTRLVRTEGWPCRCVWGAYDIDPLWDGGGPDVGVLPISPPVALGAVWIGRTLDKDDRRGIGGYLPITPIWSGLAVDTLFYGAIAWGLLFVPRAVRRWRRRRGGRCVKCGYDRTGLAAGAACPECGASSGAHHRGSEAQRREAQRDRRDRRASEGTALMDSDSSDSSEYGSL